MAGGERRHCRGGRGRGRRMGRMGNFDALNFSPLTNANAECVTKIEIENVLIRLRNFASSDPSTATDGSYGERAHEG